MSILTTHHEKGVTLVELMVALVVLGIGALALIQVFGGVQSSIQYSKVMSLASNLAQEKMQILKEKSYYNVLVTTSIAMRVDTSTPIIYDIGFYPPENITEGSMQFIRYTYVQVITENSGNLETLGPQTSDIGMKLITISVVWQSGREIRTAQINSVLTNLNTGMSTCIFQGVVRDKNTLVGIPNATVNIAEDVGWRDTTDAAGIFKINMSPGNFSVVVNAAGYFDALTPISIAPNQNLAQNLDLSPMSTGTVRGWAWLNNHLLISQVVASTATPEVGNVEYIELYNPTSSPITIGTEALWWVPNIMPVLFDQFDNKTFQWLNYVHSDIPANGYYLIASQAGPFSINGVSMTPDAYYRFPGNLMTPSEAGGVGLAYYGWWGNWSANRIDSLSWSKTSSGHPAPNTPTEGTAISSVNGLTSGESFVRKTDPSGYTAGQGRAYDSNDNSQDFLDDPGMTYGTYTSAAIQTPISGTPALGAYVSVTDSLSGHTTVYATGSPVYGEFLVPRVATGTWDVYLSSGAYYAQISTVTITPNTTTWVPNSGTVPAWTSPGAYNTSISLPATVGYITGRVTDVNNAPLSITVTAGGVTRNTNADGYYFLPVPPSPPLYIVTANPNLTNGTYVSVDNSNITVNLGQVISGLDFALSQGGRISGFVSRDGTNGLPGIVFAALNANGLQADQEVSDTNGRFTLINLATGTYTVQPSLDNGETSSPLTSSTTVTVGTNVSIGSFTITGAFGTITGNVTASGSPISVGALIVVTTVTIPTAWPPSLSSSTLTGAGYYIASSQETGTYSIDVRGSTTTPYNVYGYYSTFNGQTPAISSKTITGVMVTPGLTTSGMDMAW